MFNFSIITIRLSPYKIAKRLGIKTILVFTVIALILYIITLAYIKGFLIAGASMTEVSVVNDPSFDATEIKLDGVFSIEDIEYLFVYASIILTTFLLLFFLFILGFSIQMRINNKNENSLTVAQNITTKLVTAKKNHFRSQYESLKLKDDVVIDYVPNPEEQIKLILEGIEEILINAFKIRKEDISMTIMERNLGVDWSWFYRFQHDKNKKHMKATYIMSNVEGCISTARHSYETGDEIFNDTLLGKKDGIFLESDRSRMVGNKGSIYCKSFSFQHKSQEKPENVPCYIFSLSIYDDGVFNLKEKNFKLFLIVLKSFLERLELELCLYTIQSFRNSGGGES